MMKSFFKKLAFVMALAMVVTMAAPAAAKAYAADMWLAYQTGGKVTELNMEAGSSEDLCFKNAPANWAELTKTWASDNEAVAIVDKNGVVTAIADGTAKITFTLGDGTAASVKVNVGEVKPYDVTLGNAEDKAMTALELKTGTAFDLNFYGVKDWAAGKYSVTWVSNAPEVAKVDQKGNVAAVAAGTATVTAAIVNNKTGAVMNVTPVVVTVPTEVVVPAFTVKQTTADTIVVTFAEDQTYTYEDFTVTEIFDTVTVDAPIKAADFKAGTGKEVTIKMSAKFDDGETYEVAFKNDTKAAFVASVGAVTDVEFGYFTRVDDDDNYDNVYGAAYIETDEESNTVHLYPKFFDSNGIDITSVVNADDFSIDYTAVVESDKFSIGYDEITFEASGAASIKMTANWFDEEGEEYTDEWIGEIVAIRRPDLKVNYTAGAVFFDSNKTANTAWTNNSNTYTDDFTNVAWGYAWSNGKGTTEVVLDDDSVPVFVAMVSDNKKPSKTWTTPTYTAKGEITYDSSNENVFEIDPTTGEITAKKVGSAAVLVYFTANDSETPVLVGSTKVTVKAARYPASVTISTTQAKIANDGLDTKGEVIITVKDQYGSKIDLANGTADLTVEATSSKTTTDLSDNLDWKGKGEYRIKFNADEFEDVTTTSKSWSYNVALDKTENPKLDKSKVSFSVRVYNVAEDMVALENGSNVNYAVKYDGSWGNSVDVKVNNSFINFSSPSSKVTEVVKTQSIKVYFVNKNGFRLAEVENLELYNADDKKGTEKTVYYTITEPTIKKAGGTNNAVAIATGNSITWKFNTNSATSQAFSAYATEGNYKVTLYTTKSQKDDTIKKLGDWNVTVTNSQPEVTYGGYTDAYAKNSNSHYADFAKIADIVADMKNTYVEDLDDETIIAAIYDCLNFNYFPEVNHWQYNQATNALVDWDNPQAKIVKYVAKKISDSKMAIKEVTFEITLPGTSEVVYQTVRVNASISK